MPRRIQYKRYALINKQGIIWEGVTQPTRSELFQCYTGIGGDGRNAALADGWKAKKVTLYFIL